MTTALPSVSAVSSAQPAASVGAAALSALLPGGGDNSAALLDFAALLLGQLGAGELVEDPEAALLEADEAVADSGASAAGATDFSGLFAMLGMAAEAPVQKTGESASATLGTLSPQSDKNVPAAHGVLNEGGVIGLGDGKSGAVAAKNAAVGEDFAGLLDVESVADAKLSELSGLDGQAPLHGTSPQAVRQSGAPVVAEIATPVKDAQWSAELGQKVVWVAKQDLQSAQLTLNPPHLGPLEIQLEVSNNQTHAVFSTPHAEIKEALENAIPRLREMMAGSGIELGQATVNQEAFRQPASSEGKGGSKNASAESDQAGGEGQESTVSGVLGVSPSGRIIHPQGLVDTFA